MPGNADTAVFNRGNGVTYTVTFAARPPLFPGHFSTDRLLIGPKRRVLYQFVRSRLFGHHADRQATFLNRIAPLSSTAISRRRSDITGVAATVGSSNAGMLNIAAAGTFDLSAHGSIVGLIVGKTNTSGEVDVGAGAELLQGDNSDTSTAQLGVGPNSTGVVNVDGAEAQWGGSKLTVEVGADGIGELNITNGGRFQNQDTILGNADGSRGIATLDGGGSFWDSLLVTVGKAGTGVLNITNGANMTVPNIDIGNNAGGTVNLDQFAELDCSQVSVGASGFGSLVVSGGSKVTSGSGWIERCDFLGYGHCRCTSRYGGIF